MDDFKIAGELTKLAEELTGSERTASSFHDVMNRMLEDTHPTLPVLWMAQEIEDNAEFAGQNGRAWESMAKDLMKVYQKHKAKNFGMLRR